MDASKWLSGAGVALALAGAPVAHASPSFPADAAGDWTGTLQAQGRVRHVFIHIRRTPSGGYVGTVDSPEHDGSGAPISPLAASGGALAFAGAGAQFRGDWNAARGQWQGTWTEAGASLPLSLRQDVENATGTRLRKSR